MSILHNDPVEAVIIPCDGDICVDVNGAKVKQALPSDAPKMVGPFAFFGHVGAEDILCGVALPQGEESVEPRFIDVKSRDFPVMEYDGVYVRVIMGNLWGKAAPSRVYSDTLYLDVDLHAGATFELPIEAQERGIYVLNGSVEIAGIVHKPNRLLVLRPYDQVVVKGCDENSAPVRLVVMGGAAMDEPEHLWWNFLSPDNGRIEQAKVECKAGRFAKVEAGDEFIPSSEV